MRSKADSTGRFAAALARYHGAIGRAQGLAGTRSLADGPTAGELLLEGQWESSLRPVLSEMYRRPIAAGLPEMMEMDRTEITRLVMRFYREQPDVTAGLDAVLGRYARRGFDLGGQMGLDELRLYGQFALADGDIDGQIEAHVGRLMSLSRQGKLSLAATTAEEIGVVVERKRDEGVELADLLPWLSAWVLGRTVVRSAMIAATESVRMTRWGMVSAFAGNGIRGVRHECEANVAYRCTSGACPPLCGTEYELGGVLNPMRGISMASQIPLHVRCILPGNEVVIPGRLSAATKSFYDGRAVEITVRSGRVLTVTENHPILTPGGYVAAKLLREGDDVLSARDTHRIAAAVNPDDDYIPTTIEEVFRTLKESPFVVSARVPVAAEDFHGDGRAVYGDVDVVYIDRLLESAGVTAIPQQVGEFVFSGDGMGFGAFPPLGLFNLPIARRCAAARGIIRGGDLSGPLFRGHLRPFEGFGFGSVPGFNSGTEKSPTYSPSVDTQVIGDHVFGFTGQVTGNDRVIIERKAELAPILEHTRPAHETDDSVFRHTLLARQFADRFAGDITPDEIVGIRVFNYSGHVYDLQCDDYELYITSGVITSNCRCWYSPLRDGWLKPALIWTGFAVGLLDGE